MIRIDRKIIHQRCCCPLKEKRTKHFVGMFSSRWTTLLWLNHVCLFFAPRQQRWCRDRWWRPLYWTRRHSRAVSWTSWRPSWNRSCSEEHKSHFQTKLNAYKDIQSIPTLWTIQPEKTELSYFCEWEAISSFTSHPSELQRKSFSCQYWHLDTYMLIE